MFTMKDRPVLCADGLETKWYPKLQSESMPDVRQLIPYILYRYKDKFLVYQRKSSTTLDGLLSIGFGGHIELDDDIPSPRFSCKVPASDVSRIVLAAAFREFCEETLYAPCDPTFYTNTILDHHRRKFMFEGKPVSWQWFQTEPISKWFAEQWVSHLFKLPSFALDTDAVSRAHKAIPYIYTSPKEPEIHLDPKEATFVGWFTVEELRSHPGPFESWSSHLIPLL